MADAAVGSIAHILKTAFKDLYEEKRERDEAANSLSSQPKMDESGEQPQPEQIKVEPKKKRLELLDLGEHHKSELVLRAQEIERDLIAQNEKADDLVRYLQEQRDIAKVQRIQEEEQLKKQGIIIGQHIPPLPTKLNVDPFVLSQYGKFSSSLVIAHDLVDQNKTNTLRRTGNLPISENLEQVYEKRGKHQQSLDSDAPHYLELTGSQKIRETVNKVRFNEPLARRTAELTARHAEEGYEPPVVRKKKSFGLTGEQKDENETILKGINHKLNYLRNPRNDPVAVSSKLLTKSAKISSSFDGPIASVGGAGGSKFGNEGGSADITGEPSFEPSNKSKASSVSAGHNPGKNKKSNLLVNQVTFRSILEAAPAPLFITEPKRILFNGYELGNEYKKSVTFRNVSSVSRSIRVLPPRTAQFSLSPLQYPQNSRAGLVAPGMNVTSVITFYPNSLMDFNDVVTVETEGGSYSVPILARRESPKLLLPPTFSVGSCLVGDAIRTSVRCCNGGGPGNFHIITMEEFQQNIFVSESKDCLRLLPFCIYPLEFNIDKNAHVDLTIEFIPRALGTMSAEFVIYSDTGHSFKYTVSAQSLQTDVYISEINSTHVNRSDPSIMRDLYFNTSFIGSTQTQKLSITNDTGLPIEYEWVWIDSKAKDIKRASIDKLIESEKNMRDLGLEPPSRGYTARTDTSPGIKLENFEASLPLPAPPGKLIAMLEPPSGKKRGGRSPRDMPTVGDTLRNEISMLDGDNEDVHSKNIATFNGFEISPARAMLGVDSVVSFNISYSPTTLEPVSGRLVLLLRKVPQPALQDKSQSKHLSTLATYGHGNYLKLRSWIADMSEVCPIYNGWICGSAAAMGASPVALTPDVVKIINLKTILSLAMNHSYACYDDHGEPTAALHTLLYRIREIIRFVVGWRSSEFSAEEEFTLEEEELRRSQTLTVTCYDWHVMGEETDFDITSLGAKQVPPLDIIPRDWKTRTAHTPVPPEEPLTAKERLQLTSIWINVDTAVRVLGNEICETLDPLISHESTDYIQSLVRFDLPCLHLQVSGAGQAYTLSIEPPRITIGGTLSIGKLWSGKVLIKNPSMVIADIDLDTVGLIANVIGHSEEYLSKKETDELKPIAFASTNPSHLLLLPQSEAYVDVELYLGTVGSYKIEIPVKSSNQFAHIDNIIILVKTIGPMIRFETPEVDIGLMSTGLEGRKSFQFTNESDVALRFALTAAIDPKCITNSINKSVAKTDEKPDRRKSSRKTSKMTNSSVSGSQSARNGSNSARTTDSSDDEKSLNSARSSSSVASKDSYTIESPTASVWYEPNSGLVKPGEVVTVTIVCTGGKLSQRLRGNTECNVSSENGSVPLLMQFLPFRAEIQMPKAVVTPINVNIGTVFENVSIEFEVMIQNYSNLPSKYKFERPGGSTPLYTIEFLNGCQTGTLSAKEHRPIRMKFTAFKQGIISDLWACKVFGVPVPVGFSLTVIVKALSLEFLPLLDASAVPVPLGKPTDRQYSGSVLLGEPVPIVPLEAGHLGAAVKLYERREIKFVIRNLSAIAAQFSIAPRKYDIGVVSEDVRKQISFTKTIMKTDALLIPHEDGENKYHSVNGKNYVGSRIKRIEDRDYLSLGQGASYGIEPRAGSIPPWGVQIVTVFARNDMPGCFDDEIICDVLNYRKVSIPIKMTVIGCPLVVEKDTYGITSMTDPDSGVDMPLLLMGDLCKDEEAPERQFRVRNNGSVPTKVKWSVRSISSKVNGPVKVELKLGADSKISSKFVFWEDLAKETPFLVEPKTAFIPPYGSQAFKVKLLRTCNVCSEKGLLTGSVILAEDEDVNDSAGAISSANTAAAMFKSTSKASTTSLAGAQYKLNVQLQGNIMNPCIRLDEHVIPVNFPESTAPSAAGIFMRTMVPLLFASGGKNFDLCSKEVVLCNPLTANLVFTVSVEGPFILKGSKDGEILKPKIIQDTPSPVLDESLFSVSHVSTLGKTFTLLPDATANVIITLAPKRDLRLALKNGTGPSTKSVQQREENGNLVLSFWTGQMLKIPISVVLATPLIVASASKLNFGVCHCTMTCEGTLLLSNPTDVIARWMVTHIPDNRVLPEGTVANKKTSTIRVGGFEEKLPAIDDPSVFIIAPNAGQVMGPSISITATMAAPSKDYNRSSAPVVDQRLVQSSWASQSLTMQDTLTRRHETAHQSEADPLYPMPLSVKFCPSKNTRYSSRFRFVCEYGNTFDVIFEAEGTYEEHMHKPLYPAPRI